MTAKRIMLGVPCFAESRELLESCLRSFMEAEVDVVAVDNGGGADVKAVLNEMESSIMILRNQVNVYVNPAWNQLAAHFLASESEILLIANADLIAAPNWSASLLNRYDHARSTGAREYWLGRALSTEEESLLAQTPSIETVTHSAGGSVSGAFFAMSREAASFVFPIPPELLIHCGDDWIHLLLSGAGFRQLILRDMAVWHKGFVSGSRLPEFSAVIDRDRVLWDSRFSKICCGLGAIERQYIAYRDAPSDINEHIPMLAKYAKGCESVTELGVGRSTWGLLRGRPRRLRSYDVRDAEMSRERRVAAEVGIDFAFQRASSLSIDIDETDLLFIDTIHTYEQLRRELALHAPKTRKHIVLHDTETFGARDEVGSGPGLWPAVEEFIKDNPDWKMENRLRNNNGLTVLTRDPGGRRGLTLVSAFFRLRDRSIDEDSYFRWFDQLAAGDLPILLFLDERLMDRAPNRTNVRVVPTKLESLWTFLTTEGRELRLPSQRTEDKDTRDFLLFINAKIDLMEMALSLDDRSSHFAWIDFGIMKVVRKPEAFLTRLGRLMPPASCVLAPGCWTRERADQTSGEVNWRFCGGFLIVDRDSIHGLVENYRTQFARLALHRGRLTWEVNVWAAMERAGQRFDWYKADHDDSIVGGEVRICLNMIVKNEFAIIERCLDAALPFISTWVIADTGSTDGTPAKIEQFFATRGVPGKLVHFPFKNFAQARNAALTAARTVPGWDYALLLDADMVIDGELDTDRLCGPAYKIMQRDGGALEYWNTRLVRRDAPASYVSVTHEYLSVDGVDRLDGLFVIDRGDGGSKGDKGERDIRLLSEGLAEEPNNARYMFYLAQTYRGMGRHSEAIQWYRRRIERGGWDEEVWASYYGIARCYRDLGDEINLVKACLDAHNFRPTRGESLKVIAKFYRERGKNEAAMVFAEALSTLLCPDDELFVERDVYDVGADQEISIAGYWSKIPSRREAGYRACAKLTVSGYGYAREEARKNFTHYAKSAHDLFGAEVRPIDWKPSDGYAPMNPSVCVGADGRRLVLVRTVNYTVTSEGQYPTVDGSGIIKTRNHVVEFDADWRPVRSTHIEDVSGLPRSAFPVEGFEDCRLWQDGDRCFASTTVRNLADNADGRCEIAILRFDEKWCITEARPVRDYEHDKTQKNWMPIAGRPSKFLYLCDPTIVIDTAFGTTTEVSRHPAPACLVDLRGGSQLIEHEGGWLAITHEVAWRPERVYLHRFVKFDPDFKAIGLSDPFYFARVGIEFCAGLARDGDRLVASFGVNDASAHLALFDPARVDRSIRKMRKP